MEIKKAKSENLTELMMFFDKMCEVMGEKDFLPNGNKGGFPPQEMVEKAIEEQNLFTLIEDHRIVAAYILNSDCDSSYKTVKWNVDAGEKGFVVMHALRVLPEYGGRGYSKKLLGHAIETAKEWGMKAFRLDVAEGNDIPEKMYYSFGFEYVDTVQITYPDIGYPINFRLLELVL